MGFVFVYWYLIYDFGFWGLYCIVCLCGFLDWFGVNRFGLCVIRLDTLVACGFTFLAFRVSGVGFLFCGVLGLI